MRIEKSGRGFKYVSFTDLYGSECSLQESSLATDRAIWLGVDRPSPSYRMDKTAVRMHLNQEQVKDLLPLLQKFVKTGRLSDEGNK